jgi:hypothetical protein
VRQADGGATQVLSTVTSNGTRGRKSEGSDALSVLGQFSVETNSKTADVGLGKFFATGLAAQKLADGFGERLAGPSLEAAAAVEKAKPKATEGSASAPSK